MNVRFIAIAAALTGLLGAASANAADLSMGSHDQVVTPPPYVAQAFSWTGFYFGGNVGFATLNDTVSHYSAGSGCWWTPCSAIQGLHDSGTGLVAGGQLGYNFQSGHTVFGVEADLDWAGVDTTPFNKYPQGGGYFDYTQKTNLDAIGTLRARAGFTMNRLLVYGTGGLAFGQVHNYVNDNNDPGHWEATQWRTGWTAGGGLEYALANHWTLKGEVLYYDLGTTTLNFKAPLVPYGGGTYPAKFSNDGIMARFGANYLF